MCKITGIYPPALLIQIINSFIGLFLAAISIMLRLKYIEPQHGGVFEVIIKAIEKIAMGDFNVKLDNENEGKGPFGELVKSVSYALRSHGYNEFIIFTFV